MPAAFNSCMNSPGHKVFTVKPNPGTYIHVCKPSKGGSVGGEVHHKKKGSSGPKKTHSRARATRMKSKTGGSFRKGGGGRIGRRR